MTALEIIGMILLLFLLLSLLRVGAIVDFGGELRVRLRVGPVKLTVLPRKEKKAQKKAAEAGGGRTPPAEAQLSRAARACGDGARRAEADASPHLPPHAH